MKHKKIANYKEGIRAILNPGYGHDCKSYIKVIAGIDRTRQDGYAFQGSFLECRARLTENEMDTGAVYLVCGEYETPTGRQLYACLALYDGVQFVPWGEIVTGYDYALKLREKAEYLLMSKAGFRPDIFIEGLRPGEILALRQHLLQAY